MLSYRHSFHAGNHADVLKHIVQSLIIDALKTKDKPFLYLDTHAGAGRYLLTPQQGGKTGEYVEGIARLWQRQDTPADIHSYLTAVKTYNPHGQLRYYPGSPLIARQLLRPQDKMYLTELHPSDYPLLRNELQKDHRAIVTRANGYQQIKAQLPPLSRRALILIDPPYEMKTDYHEVVEGIEQGYKRFASGVYALWYPVVRRQWVNRMLRALQASGIRHILQIELAIRPDNQQRGMTASGMIVVNPPWKLEQQIRHLLPWLQQVLAPSGAGHHTVTWLVPE